VTLTAVDSGALGPTLIPHSAEGVAGLILRLPEWFENDTLGRTRRPGPFGHYLAIPPEMQMRLETAHPDLFHPSDSERDDEVIYLHEWLAGPD
jgi:hypothetical protein